MARVLGEPLLVGHPDASYPAGRPGRLLTALLLARGRSLTQQRLVDDVWGEELPADPRAALHTTVARLRRALGPRGGDLDRVGTGYRLARDHLLVDAELFLEEARPTPGEAPAQALVRCEGALARWRGPAWAGHADDLARGEASRLDAARLEVREQRAAALLDLGRTADAIGELRVLVAEEPLRERAVGLLMTGWHRAGDVGAALEVWTDHRERLADELGLDPSPALVELHRSVLQRRPEEESPNGGGPAGPPAPAPGRPALLGREAALGTLTQMLDLHRCVTLVGTGGVGKTSLAATAVSGRDHWWVDLARVTDPALVVPTAADALGVDLHPGTPVEASIAARLAALDGVVVVDNCEHLIAAAADLVDRLLRAGPRVRVLATSRERLALDEERVLPLPPLQLPAPGTADAGAPSVALFLERARAVAPDLEPDDAVLATVADLVRRLDGLPLAIELAAGRVGSVSLDDLRDRIVDRADLLRTTSPRASARQRALASTIAWSYELLDAEEQRAFRWLSRCAGSFDLATAEALLGPDAIDLVPALAERSLLVRPATSGPGAYRMLETLRSYAASLLDADEQEALALAHARWLAGLATDVGRGLLGPEESRWTHRMDQAAADLPVALGWAIEHGEAALAAEMLAGAHRWAYFRLRGDLLGRAHDALALGPAGRTAGVHLCASAWHWMRGEHREGREQGELALAAARTAHELAAARDALSDNALAEGDLDASRRHSREGLEVATAAGEWTDAAAAACALVLATTYAGDDAAPMLEEAHALAHRGGSRSWIAFMHYAEGEVHADRDPQRALAALATAHRVADEVDNRLVAGVAVTAETALLARAGPLDRTTVERCCAAVEHWRRSGSERLFLTCLRNLVPLLDRLGAHAALVELVAATEGQQAYGAEADRLGVALDRAAAALDPDRMAAARSAGSVRTLDAAATAVVAALRASVTPAP